MCFSGEAGFVAWRCQSAEKKGRALSFHSVPNARMAEPSDCVMLLLFVRYLVVMRFLSLWLMCLVFVLGACYVCDLFVVFCYMSFEYLC